MLITFDCTNCGSTLEIEADTAGSQVECPECSASLTVPKKGIEPGTTVGGFRVEKLLGEGGMGQVFLARQLSTDRNVALKILPAEFSTHLAGGVGYGSSSLNPVLASKARFPVVLANSNSTISNTCQAVTPRRTQPVTVDAFRPQDMCMCSLGFPCSSGKIVPTPDTSETSSRICSNRGHWKLPATLRPDHELAPPVCPAEHNKSSCPNALVACEFLYFVMDDVAILKPDNEDAALFRLRIFHLLHPPALSSL